LHANVKGGRALASDWWDGKPFDHLADVPCTASGIVRRHPDIFGCGTEGRRLLQLAGVS
jgi:16S rRNA C967 or C1407 C5-methylase (RsmB/RsmF family)